VRKHHDAILIMMRTTLNIPDDIYEVVRSVAEARGIPLGEALGELVRRSLRSEVRVDNRGIFPGFIVPEGAAPITLEQTLSAEDEV
jgi:hypothetical protein